METGYDRYELDRLYEEFKGWRELYHQRTGEWPPLHSKDLMLKEFIAYMDKGTDTIIADCWIKCLSVQSKNELYEKLDKANTPYTVKETGTISSRYKASFDAWSKNYTKLAVFCLTVGVMSLFGTASIAMMPAGILFGIMNLASGCSWALWGTGTVYYLRRGETLQRSKMIENLELIAEAITTEYLIIVAKRGTPQRHRS